MLLLLARHGNTFDKGDKVVWVGASTDLPLTAKGREQAQALGQALTPYAGQIKRVISGPLLRTCDAAAIICEALNAPSPLPLSREGRGDRALSSARSELRASPLPPAGEGQGEGAFLLPLIDERLREIDYGQWEAKSSEEIEALGGAAELEAWNKKGEWPRTPGWTPTPDTIAANAAALADSCAAALGEDDAALLVTSNGVLKFFLKLVPGAFENMAFRGELKVATGNCCALRHSARGWEVAFWNRAPSHLAL